MTRRQVKLSTLTPNPRNPRVIDDAAFEKLVESLRRDPSFMALRPIVYDADRMILGGNQRYRALVHLKHTSVPVAWTMEATDLTEAQRRRFILVDNHPEGMSGEWDADLLKQHYDLATLSDLGLDLYKLELLDHPEPLRASDHWQGMPSFENPSALPWLSITVTFPTEAAFTRFAQRIGQFVSPQTKYIWHPPEPDLDMEHHTT